MGHGRPALVIDAAITEHLEVLGLVLVGRFGIVEGVQHADALDRVLLHAIHKQWLGKSRCFENRRRNVDHMVELRADLAFGFDPLRPMNDGSVPGPAKVRRDLLGPLVGRVHGVGPADRIVVVGLRAAELVEPLRQILGRLHGLQAIEVAHLVKAAVDRSLGRGAVVTDDVEDERVIKDVELLQRVENSAHMMIGVFHEAGIDLHLTAQYRFECSPACRPTREFRRGVR